MALSVDEQIQLVAGLHDGARLSRTGLFNLLAKDVERWVAGPLDAFAGPARSMATTASGNGRTP
jgi:hypothetical protein